ncbi:uncharacterized protein LOC117784900 [Drosophila innubila]|uniref:uncharacterized protein LOC117784900 n=1 Tax=Drosophila innubila TaxID=198719 RepID=UPI00148E5716|nr:uncharacterized protein LOC117784900 [Drosophila innubila]
MADDEDKPKRHTLDTLFHVYCNHKVIPTELDNEVFNSILLSQLDAWLEQAKLMPIPITRVQTGLIYMRYKKWRLNMKIFLRCCNNFAAIPNLTMMNSRKLIAAGPPTGGTDIVVVK